MGRPVLLNSCARATTRAESQFRIDYPLPPARATRVVALDDESLAVVRVVASEPWAQASFFTAAEQGRTLLSLEGEESPLRDVLHGVDTLVMVAATGENLDAAATIGDACSRLGVMTAGLVLSSFGLTSDALLALRPYARILMVPAEPDDLVELLRAMRA